PSSLIVNDCAATEPNRTPVAEARSAPNRVTVSPPLVNPLETSRPVTTGTAVENVKRSTETAADVPPVVVTVTSTWPEAWPGAVAVIVPLAFTVKDAAETPPNETPVTCVKFVPVIVIIVPPVVDPTLALKPAIVGGGGGAAKVNRSAVVGADLPFSV